LTVFSELVKCEKSRVFKGVQRFCACSVGPVATNTRSRKNVFFEHHCLHIVRIFREITPFCTLFPLFPYRTIPVVVSYVVKPKIRLKAESRDPGKAFPPH